MKQKRLIVLNVRFCWDLHFSLLRFSNSLSCEESNRGYSSIMYAFPLSYGLVLCSLTDNYQHSLQQVGDLDKLNVNVQSSTSPNIERRAKQNGLSVTASEMTRETSVSPLNKLVRAECEAFLSSTPYQSIFFSCQFFCRAFPSNDSSGGAIVGGGRNTPSARGGGRLS